MLPYADQHHGLADVDLVDGVPEFPSAWYPAMVLWGQLMGVFPLRFKPPAGKAGKAKLGESAWRLSSLVYVINVLLLACTSNSMYIFVFVVDYNFVCVPEPLYSGPGPPPATP